MAIFRLLHASDLHIALKQNRVGLVDAWKAGLLFRRDRPEVALTSSHSPDLLDGLIEFVFQQDDPFDAVLLSGDLATTGKKEDLKEASSWINGDQNGYVSPHSGRPEIASNPTLKGAARKIVLLPGNHDRYQNIPGIPFFVPGGILFNNYFGVDWDFNPKVKVNKWVSPHKEGAHLGLVSADLTLKKFSDAENGLFGVRGSFGQGKAYADIIDALKKKTDDLREKHRGLGLLWVVHFPPKYPKIEEDFLQLLQDEILIKAAHEKRISHILAGHTHKPLAYTARSSDGSTVEVLCAGTATQLFAPDGNFIHQLMIEIEGEEVTSVRSRTFRWHDQVGAREKNADQIWVPVVCPKKKA